MKLRSKFIVSIILITVLMSGIAIYIVNSHIKEAALGRARIVTAEYVKAKAQERLTLTHFIDRDFHQQKDAFQEFMNHIRTREILKIKVINSRFDIIYSTNEEDIGKKTDSINYRNALSGGSVIAVIKPPITEASNNDIRGYNQVMEIYVPIEYNGMAAGVIEAYFKMDGINKEVLEISRYVLGLIIAFSLLVIGVVYVLLTFLVLRPLRMLGIDAGRIAAGSPGTESQIKDEIGALTALLKNVLDKGTPAKIDALTSAE